MWHNEEVGIQLSKDQLAILADTRERIDFGPGAFTVTTKALFQADGVESSVVNHSETKITSDSNIIPYSQYLNETQQEAIQNFNSSAQQDAMIIKWSMNHSHEQNAKIDGLKHSFSEQLKEKESLMKTVTVLKNDFKKKESRNIDREIALEKKIKLLDNIKAQQLEPKLYDGNVIKNTSAIVIPDSEETLILAEESQPSPSCTPTKVEVPKELPKVSMVNASLKKLKHHLAGFDKVVRERTTSTAITEGTWGFEHTKACFRGEIIPFVKALKDIFNNFDQYLIDELTEVQNVFNQMEQAVEQHRLESKTFDVKLNQKDFIEKETYDKLFRSYTTLEKHFISLEVDTQLNQEIFQSDNSVSNQSAPNFVKYFELNELKALSQETDTIIRKLKERIKSLSGNVNEKNVKKYIDEIESINIELEHIEKARTSNPLDNALAYGCMYTRQIQELLVYVSDTCSSSLLKSEKLVSVTPINKARKVTLAKTSTTSDNNIQIQVDVHQTQTTNKPLMPSTNEKCSTNASTSKPRSETKNNRIMQPLSKNYNYQKVEAHTRNAKPSLTKEDSESKSMWLTCNKCYFDARHDLCVVQYLSEVNDHARAKAVKSIKMKEWKPTRLGLHQMTSGYISLGLVQNPCSSTPNVPPSKRDWDNLLQPLFDEYFNPTPCVVSYASTSPTNQYIQSQVIHQGV
ncbi:hypothetical protein Tco_1203566 [Tanacetum coccineum]